MPAGVCGLSYKVPSSVMMRVISAAVYLHIMKGNTFIVGNLSHHIIYISNTLKFVSTLRKLIFALKADR